MQRVAVAGLSIQDVDVSALEHVRRPGADDEAVVVGALADDLAASEAVMVCTCNRVEVFFARELGALPGPDDLAIVAEHLGLAGDDPLRHRLRMRRGRDAARHLLRVVASLDSLVLGEAQIVAQVRDTHARARQLGMTGPLLDPLFEAAYRVGKRVRTETGLARKSVSVVALGVAELCDRLRATASGTRVAVLGAGRTARLAATLLSESGLVPAVIANRSLAPARALAGVHGAEATTIEAFRAGHHRVDAVVSATSSPATVLSTEDVGRLSARRSPDAPLLCVDLAVPRDIATPPGGAAASLIDLDRLRERAERNRAARAEAARLAEDIIDRELDGIANAHLERRLATTLSGVLEESRDRFEHQLGLLLRGRLAELSTEHRVAVERWARTTFGRMAHVPLAACKRLARDVPDVVDVDAEETVG